jgi:hypothetical protein
VLVFVEDAAEVVAAADPAWDGMKVPGEAKALRAAGGLVVGVIVATVRPF